MGIELEQKYVVDSQRPWQVQAELLSLLNRAGYEVRLLGETPQEDVYYDTTEDDFLLTGGSLRVRRRGERRVLTLKTPLAPLPGVRRSWSSHRMHFRRAFCGSACRSWTRTRCGRRRRWRICGGPMR